MFLPSYWRNAGNSTPSNRQRQNHHSKISSPLIVLIRILILLRISPSTVLSFPCYMRLSPMLLTVVKSTQNRLAPQLSGVLPAVTTPLLHRMFLRAPWIWLEVE